jgi:hypothetical protein
LTAKMRDAKRYAGHINSSYFLLLTMEWNAALTSEQPFVLVPCQGGSLCNRCLQESEDSAIHFWHLEIETPHSPSFVNIWKFWLWTTSCLTSPWWKARKLSTFGRGLYCIEGPLSQKPYFLDCAMYIVANLCTTHEHLLVHPVGHCRHLNWGL